MTFQCAKLGCTLDPGRDYAGELVVRDIGVDTSGLEGDSKVAYALEEKDAGSMLPGDGPTPTRGITGKPLS